MAVVTTWTGREANALRPSQWGRYEHGLNALRSAYEVAPEEIRCRPLVQRIASNLAVLTRGHVRTAVFDFAQRAGVRV